MFFFLFFFDPPSSLSFSFLFFSPLLLILFLIFISFFTFSHCYFPSCPPPREGFTETFRLYSYAGSLSFSFRECSKMWREILCIGRPACATPPALRRRVKYSDGIRLAVPRNAACWISVYRIIPAYRETYYDFPDNEILFLLDCGSSCRYRFFFSRGFPFIRSSLRQIGRNRTRANHHIDDGMYLAVKQL